MTDNKVVFSKYQEEVFKLGNILYVVVYAFIILFPLGVSIIFKAFPNGTEMLKSALSVIPTYWAVGIVEYFTYLPMLGAGGSYLGFITGNMSNIKVPVSIQAMDQAGYERGTEEGDCISTIAIAISSIVTTAIVIIFALLSVPLTPIFTNEVLAPAFADKTLIAALFGALMVAYLSKDPKFGIPVVALGAVLFIAIPTLDGIYPIVLVVLALIAILLARILYKKGKLD